MPNPDLVTFLGALDWHARVTAFCANSQAIGLLEPDMRRFEIWALQIERAEPENEAVRFVREARFQASVIALLLSLGLYKPAASAMRATVECVLYYTYFRSHPVELATLTRDKSFFVLKNDVVDFHKSHTPLFEVRAAATGLLSKLGDWYSKISAIVHGQLPGEWSNADPISDAQEKLLPEALKTLHDAIEVVDAILFSTVTDDLWSSFEVTAKRKLLSGMSGAVKGKLGLSVA